jgi:hypothetical protein
MSMLRVLVPTRFWTVTYMYPARDNDHGMIVRYIIEPESDVYGTASRFRRLESNEIGTGDDSH